MSNCELPTKPNNHNKSSFTATRFDLIPAPIVPTVPALVPAPVQVPCSVLILVQPQREVPAAAPAAPTKPTIGLVCDSDDKWEPAGEAAPRIHPAEQEEEYGDSTVPDRIIQLQLNRQRRTRIPFHERDESNIHRSGAERRVGCEGLFINRQGAEEREEEEPEEQRPNQLTMV
ncbi:hypothetical protein DAPPUDRAFT_265078 [Daphnia pulex]|uniref:Uncharacterized protein n=1 Tax=Daphnia pulex TaxID=6669 RepID=E9HSU3_DAPPU|nr:hypothetical protein DAPPUDRAFT_265078 [Daphnia pulex]|eukprot:EFX65174.1 hypothetical protein DAPPUDRAFT_265078 [Daphnia pulex]